MFPSLARLAQQLSVLALAVSLVGHSAACAQSAATATSLRVETDQDSGGWNLYAGDDLFATYLPNSNGKPIIYPLLGPEGHHMTRNYPMVKDVEGERSDHPHHRSMWFTHGDVNGIDFWLDDEKRNCGKIVQTKGTATVERESGAILVATENEWIAPGGKRFLTDKRHYRFHESDGRRIIDCDHLVIATDGDVNFGDTKEGSFAIRVSGTMKVDAELGGKITNAEGAHDKAAWGLRSAWVDYNGPVDGDSVGVTMHEHPSSFGSPCRWHVRTYGLFAANPFGEGHFTGAERNDGITLQAGETMRLNYRMVIYAGDFDADQASEDSKQYASSPRPEIN